MAIYNPGTGYQKWIAEDFKKEYDQLSEDQKIILSNWIDKNCYPTIKSINYEHHSYGLKHVFERSDRGYYITNDQFKYAMWLKNFLIDCIDNLNWCFNISSKSNCMKNFSNY